MRRSLPVALALLAGCWPSIPEGQYVCERDQDCPPRWFCVDALCYSQPLEFDASLGDAGDANVDAQVCAPVSLTVDDLEMDAIAEFWLDFDTIPGSPGSEAELCLTFDSSNPASVRHIELAGQQIGFGPCDGATVGPWTWCRPYLKPAGTVFVRLVNATTGPGCQSGPMTGIELRFLCP